MTHRRGGNFDEPDFDLPFSFLSEGEAMLQSSPTPKNLSTSTTPEPLPVDHLPTLPRPARHHSSYIHGPLTHEASSSNSPTTPIDSPPFTAIANPLPDPPFTGGTRSQRATISSLKSFASSPLNPTFPSSPFGRSASRGSAHINRIASEESRALASHNTINHSGSRGSMILYRRADLATEDGLHPPSRSHLNRHSIYSTSGDSIVSLSSDSKYPFRTIGSERGLIAYAYDPSLDDLGSSTPTDDDYLHDPDDKFPQPPGLFPAISARGAMNILTLVALIAALLCLFVVYPVIRFYHDNGRNVLITFNTRINDTGQAEMVIVDRRSQILFAAPIIPLIDPSTAVPARILKTAQDIIYELVFSDEFNKDTSSSASSSSDDVYDTSQIDTKDGTLLVRLDTLRVEQTQGRRHRFDRIHARTSVLPGLGSESGPGRGSEKDEYEGGTGGLDVDVMSGMLSMKVPFCLRRGGFVEVGLGSWSGEGGEERRLVYWPSSSDSWSSLNPNEIPSIPANLLSHSESGPATSLTLSIADSRVMERTRRRAEEVEVDYVRIYQPIKSSSSVVTETEARWECAMARDEYVLLDVLQV